MAPTKRNITEVLDDDDDDDNDVSQKRLKKPCLDIPSPSTQSKDLSERKLAYPSTTDATFQKPTPFQKPLPLLTFSYTASRSLEFTDSALRYFVPPPPRASLNYGYDRWIRRPEEKGRLDGLLKAWSRVLGRARNDNGGSGMEVGLIAWRGVMTRILTAPYEERDGWDMNVMCVNGTMYFEEHISDAKLAEKDNLQPRHRLQSYYGYAFESYCTSSVPDRRQDMSAAVPGWGGDVDTNIQWCSVVKTKLGNTRMIIGGEVDCVRGTYSGHTDNFVELKTSLTIRGPEDEGKFEKKLLKFYFQSFLLGVPEIFVGFRTPSGEVATVQSFKTIQIPRLVRGKPGAWDPSVCLAWGQQFLTFLKDIIRQHGANPDRRVWRVKFNPRVGVSITLLDEAHIDEVKAGEDRVGFLPKWYWDEVHPASSKPTIDALPPGWQI